MSASQVECIDVLAISVHVSIKCKFKFQQIDVGTECRIASVHGFRDGNISVKALFVSKHTWSLRMQSQMHSLAHYMRVRTVRELNSTHTNHCAHYSTLNHYAPNVAPYFT